MLDQSDWERLQEIRDELKDLIEEAGNLVRMSGDRFAYERAKAYWLGYMQNAIDGKPLIPCDMDETIRSLEPGEESDEEEEEDEG